MAACLLVAGLATACTPAAGQEAAPAPASCAADRLVPDDGVLLGVSIDWTAQTLAGYAADLGSRPAVAVSFAGFPLTDDDVRNLDGAAQQLAGGGALLLTLEPRGGLATVTDTAADDLARRLRRLNDRGLPVVVRFAHEMNGSWYAWGQQPEAYVAAFRRVAAALHAGAPDSATMWAPNYGGGYPYTGGRFAAAAGTHDAEVLDTDSDGAVTAADDPYAPYWPGDDAVDWVGMSLYHWGLAHPWGENEVPGPDAFADRLTGRYLGAGGDERSVPDFYGVYGEGHRKPVAVPETAAFWAPGAGGAAELDVKRAWWSQVLDPGLPTRFPRLAMVNWFEWDKHEVEVDARVDWRAAGTPEVRGAFRAALPGWARWADDVPAC
jgi:hypothetical protein